MRLVRVPYIYLPDLHVKALYLSSWRLLHIIHDVHYDIPNEGWVHPQVRAFMYYPDFVKWVFIKARSELVKRGVPAKSILPDSIMGLSSRSITHFVPPTSQELADDVVWLLEKWKYRLTKGGQNLPYSYVQLAETIHGYTPQQAAIERIDYVSGRHCDYDAGWYRIQGQEKAEACGDSMENSHRISCDG